MIVIVQIACSNFSSFILQKIMKFMNRGGRGMATIGEGLIEESSCP